jgi:hypothetical protein
MRGEGRKKSGGEGKERGKRRGERGRMEEEIEE